VTNFMIAVDPSNDSEEALLIATSLLKPEDTLYILAVAETVSTVWSLGTQLLWNQVQEDVNARSRHLLHIYSDKCRSLGLKNVRLLHASGSHVGQTICDMVDKKKINHLVIGRRGVSSFQRIFTGSTSKYCVENANAIVTVAKSCLPDELHETTREQVRQVEEVERERRIREDPKLVKGRKTKRSQFQAKLLQEIRQRQETAKKEGNEIKWWWIRPVINEVHESDRKQIETAEEAERVRRIQEDKGLTKETKNEREKLRSNLLGEMHQLQDKAKQEGNELQWWNTRPVTGK